MPGPLDGVKVVEFTEIIAGPFAGMLLSDMGAEVIKVEPPWGDPWRGTQPISPTESRVFIAYNRGKRSITLDLTTDAAAEVLARLIPQMDVAIVNYRPDVAARLGVDYDSLAAINPRLIYCENTAFGRQGPDSWRPGYDMILQAMTGIMTAENKVSNGAPMHVVSSPFVDTSAGLCLAWCVCAALFHRERTGLGQKVETTLLGLALAMLGMRFVEVESLDREHNAATLESLAALRDAGVPYPELLQIYEAEHPVSPGNIYYRSYQTADGVVSLGCLSDPLRKRLLEVLGLTDIRFDADYNHPQPGGGGLWRGTDPPGRRSLPPTYRRRMASPAGQQRDSRRSGAFHRGGLRRSPSPGQQPGCPAGTPGCRPPADGWPPGQVQRDAPGAVAAPGPGPAHRRGSRRTGLHPAEIEGWRQNGTLG